MAKVGIPLALIFLTSATHLAAASRGRTPPASSVGLALTKLNNRLIVINAARQTGLAAWDQIVAVNGRRVSTETAFMSRVVSGAAPATIMVNRNGGSLTVKLAAGVGSGSTNHNSAGAAKASGFLNPANLVITAQGVMHVETARRLGLPGEPFPGSPPGPPHPHPPIPKASGFLNPALLVITSQGVMHIETARRLGLPGSPFPGSPPGPPHPQPPIPK